MDVETLGSLRPALDRFVRQFDGCIKMQASRAHLGTYVAGQLGDLPRKSVEPIALRAGVPPRTLQEFLSWHRWEAGALRDALQRHVASRHAHAHAIGIIDETAFPKKGGKTPGVQRQHCGATGKRDNCVVTVHLGYVAGDFHALLDSALFLPEETWHQDRARCRSAGIPPEVVYRPKWELGLDLLQGAVARGVRMEWLCADELYGRGAAFRLGVQDLGLTYMVEIPHTHTGFSAKDRGDAPARPVRRWAHGGRGWETFRVKTTEKGWIVKKVRAVRFRPCEERIAGEEQWLLVVRDVLDGETKIFLSNAPADTPLGTLLTVAFSRWHVERLFQEGKSEIGLDHFEGRTYQGLMRHLALSALSLLFLAEQRQRLRTEKGGPDSSPSSRSAAPPRSSSIRAFAPRNGVTSSSTPSTSSSTGSAATPSRDAATPRRAASCSDAAESTSASPDDAPFSCER
jgi:SRSO17 transposase